MDKHAMQSFFINKQKKILTVLILFLLLFIIYWNSNSLPISPIRYWYGKSHLPVAKLYNYQPSKVKTILYWNSFFGRMDMYLGTGSSIFQNCSVKNCFATYNKSYQPVELYDAVIFHGPRYSVFSDGAPEARSVHQKYIFYSLESPYNVDFEESTKSYFYNWTMTYRRDSDIHKPYDLVVKQPRNYQPPSVEQVKNRTGKIAWFVSNCHTYGSKRRMKYASELQKHIPVDIYGKCGSFKCKTGCYEMLEKKYKFYLSFENSMCQDYVTEKMFNILKHNVVPIVLGIFDYRDIAPPNSIINTKDFKNPKELAAYLWQLDKDVDAYLKYFEWKKNYAFTSSTKYALCQLCDKLHQPLNYWSYENIEDWFYGFKCVL